VVNMQGPPFSSRIEETLDYLAHMLRREATTGKKMSPEARDEMLHLVTMISQLTPRDAYPVVQQTTRRLMSALDAGDLRMAYDSLHLLRASLRDYRIAPPERVTDRRVRELEAEVQKLREQMAEEAPEEEEAESEQEDAVKKFNKSKNRVFVIMPFSPDFDDVWNGGIGRACEENGFVALRVDQVSLSSWITEDVKEYIKKSSTVIADITGSNPNVMFELGYALGKGKDPIIICQPPSEKIPFDISGIRHIDYQDSWQGIEQLSKNLKKYLLTTQEKQKKRKARKRSEKPVQKNNTTKK